MAGAALKLECIAAVFMVLMIVSAINAQEAEAPSPSAITGAANSIAKTPSLAAGLMGSFIAFTACLFY